MLLFSVLSSTACGAAVREATKTATPAAVEGTLETASEPARRDDIATILSDPEILGASRLLSEAVASGALEGLTDAERLERTREFSAALITQVTQSLTQGVMNGMTQQLVATEPGDPGAPGEPEASAIALMARQAGHGAALGFQDAVRQTELRRQAGDERAGDVLALPAQLERVGLGTLAVLGLVLAVVGLGIVVALIGSLVRQRRVRRESQAREDALVMLASVIKSTETAPWSGELRDRLRDAARSNAAADTLRGVLRRHSGLRMERPVEPRAEEPALPPPTRMQPAR